jgi:hypothetical protein
VVSNEGRPGTPPCRRIHAQEPATPDHPRPKTVRDVGYHHWGSYMPTGSRSRGLATHWTGFLGLCVLAQARIDSVAGARLLSGLGATASAKASVVIGGRRDEELSAHPAHGLAFRRSRTREDCAHFQVADMRQGRHPADTTDRGPDRAHGFSFAPWLHLGTTDKPRATRHAPGTDRGFRTLTRPEGHQPCRAPCSRNRR